MFYREKSLGKDADESVLKNLNKTLAQYEEYYSVLDKVWQTSNAPAISPEHIEKQLTDLFTLKHFGQKLKTLYECQKEAFNSERINDEYIHKKKLQVQKEGKHNLDEKMDALALVRVK